MEDIDNVFLLSLANFVMLIMLLMRIDAQVKKVKIIESLLAKKTDKTLETSSETDIPTPVLEQIKIGNMTQAIILYKKFYDVSLHEAEIAVQQLAWKIR
jgi:hypothetical protein